MPLNLDLIATPISLRGALPLTDEELMRFSEDNKPYKIERDKHGDILIMSPVGGIGSTHEANVAYQLLHWAETNDTGGMAFISNCGFNLPDGSCLSPDTAWLPLTRWNALTPAEQAGYPPLCPDFLIEVRSQSDRRAVLEEKMVTWLDNGAQLAWLIDPIDATATLYRPGHLPEHLIRPDVVTATAPVDGFALRCERLWVPA